LIHISYLAAGDLFFSPFLSFGGDLSWYRQRAVRGRGRRRRRRKGKREGRSEREIAARAASSVQGVCCSATTDDEKKEEDHIISSFARRSGFSNAKGQDLLGLWFVRVQIGGSSFPLFGVRRAGDRRRRERRISGAQQKNKEVTYPQ
jgi:hypothetical protein